MENNILLTGASGYLGGTILARLQQAQLPSYRLYALVRTAEQADAVKKYGAEPLTIDLKDQKAVQDNVLKYEINIVCHMINAITLDTQNLIIDALSELKKKNTGKEVHFLHTSGAKMFSNFAGAPQQELFDNQPDLFDVQQAQKAPLPIFQTALSKDKQIIEQGERLGVRTYIFVPCIVYGKGEGFGNKVSIQTVAVYNTAKAIGRVCRLDDDENVWPVCHVSDTAALYVQILQNILTGDTLDYGRNGYYLAASGNAAWDDIYSGMAAAMHKRGLVQSAEVKRADDAEVAKMAEALGCPKPMVAVQLSGQCLFTAKHGAEIGWQPQFSSDHILQALDDEVAIIREKLG